MSMSMGGGGPWQTYRSFTRDRSVADRRITKGTVSRIFGFARPYRGEIIWFLVTLVFTSLLVVAQPLLFRRLVDDGIDAGNATVVTVSAVLVLVLAIVDAGIGLVGRWFSARIGEGLIFDLRTEVFGHVAAPAVGLLHPHPDRRPGHPAEQRRHRRPAGLHLHPRPGWSATSSRWSGHPGRDVRPVVADHRARLILLPLFLIPARWMGAGCRR